MLSNGFIRRTTGRVRCCRKVIRVDLLGCGTVHGPWSWENMDRRDARGLRRRRDGLPSAGTRPRAARRNRRYNPARSSSLASPTCRAIHAAGVAVQPSIRRSGGSDQPSKEATAVFGDTLATLPVTIASLTGAEIISRSRSMPMSDAGALGCCRSVFHTKPRASPAGTGNSRRDPCFPCHYHASFAGRGAAITSTLDQEERPADPRSVRQRPGPAPRLGTAARHGTVPADLGDPARREIKPLGGRGGVPPPAKNVAILRRRRGRSRSQAAKSKRIAATSAGPACRSSRSTSNQASSCRSKWSKRSTVMPFSRWQ